MQSALRAVYPPACIGCGTEVGAAFGLCGPCWRETPFIEGLVCDLCGVPLMGESDGVAVHCDECLTVARPWVRGRAALIYDGFGRKLVLRLKHGDRHEVARAAVPWLARAGREVLGEDSLLVPVPLHRWRLVRRRFNQSALLAQGLARHLGLGICPDALVRTQATPPLKGKSRDERFAAVQGSIAVNPRRSELLVGRRVVLIDDVMTSGATLAAAAEALTGAGAREISVLTLARVAKEPYLRSNED